MNVDAVARRLASTAAEVIRSALADADAAIIDLRPEEVPCSPSSSTLSPPTG